MRPRPGTSALLLGFDTDESGDSESYAQFYDQHPKPAVKKATNKTLLFVREGGRVTLETELDFIASPQKKGWLFLGQARYFEPTPRDENEHLDRLEKQGSLKNFAFDYTRVWATDSRKKIPLAAKSAVRRIKAQIDAEYRKLPQAEREYHRNITDYEKIGFVSDGFYIAYGFWSLVHGGAAWFEATEKSRLVNISGGSFSGKLSDWYPKAASLKAFQSEFDRSHRNSAGSENNDMDYFWQTWKDTLDGKTDRVPVFTFARHEAKTKFIGQLLVDGNTHRSFLASADFGSAPRKLIKYDNPDLGIEKLTPLYPDLLDVFVSPNQNTAYLLTKTEVIAVDVQRLAEIYRSAHGLRFNKVIMVEWAVGKHVRNWNRAIAN